MEPEGASKSPFAVASLLVSSLALCAAPAEPHKTLLEWARDTRAARMKGDLRAWLDNGSQALALAPDHPDLLISVARANAALGQVKESLDMLSSAAPKPNDGVSGVHAYRLNDGKLAQKYELDERPVLHGFNDLALARNGDAYVTDSAQAAVYRVHAGKLEVFVRDEHLTLANGIALAPDQKRLYVAHVEGISMLDLQTRKVQRLSVPPDASVNSIDGMAYDAGDLIGVQSSPYLARVARG